MAVEFKDYYKVLDVPRTASAEDIQKAFRKLARLYHPDVAKDKKGAEEKFKEINEAYEVLRDPEKRRRYDELGADWQQAGAFAQGAGARGRGRARRAPGGFEGVHFEFGGTGFSDFFEQFFGSGRAGFGGFGGAYGVSPEDLEHETRGADVEADILVTLEEVLRGSTRQISVRRPAPNGREERTETYQIRIPPGVREGQRIRLAGQGEPGFRGGTPGDLFLRVRLARHPDFRVQDADLYYDLDLAPWEAVLGAQVRIPTLDGTTSLKVPPGTRAGGTLRLRGLGLPRADGTRGALYAIVRIQIPDTVGADERSHWEALARASRFNPRSTG